jgi:hypothetical protein
LARPALALTSAEYSHSKLCERDVISFGKATDTDRRAATGPLQFCLNRRQHCLRVTMG